MCTRGKKKKRLTKHNEPLRLLDTVLVGLRIPESLPVNVGGFLDLVAGSVTDEDGLATPFDDDLFFFDEISVSVRFSMKCMRVENARSCPQEWSRERFRPWPGPGHRRRRTC